MTPKPIAHDTCIVRSTHLPTGRTVFITPETSATVWLRYGRIHLAGSDAPVRFDTGDTRPRLIGLERPCQRSRLRRAVDARPLRFGVRAEGTGRSK